MNEGGFVELKTNEDEKLFGSLWDSHGRQTEAGQEITGNKSIFRVQMYDVDDYYENTSGLDAEGLCKAYLKCDKPAVDMAQYGKRISLEEYAHIEQNRLDFSVDFDADQGKAVMWDGKDFYESPIPRSGDPGRVELYGQKVMLWDGNPELKLITQEAFDNISKNLMQLNADLDKPFSFLNFSDCRFEGVTFNKESFHRCSFRNAEFDHCTFKGTTMSECGMQGTKIFGCAMDDAAFRNNNFYNSEIRPIHFEGCHLIENDFGSTVWKGGAIEQGSILKNNFTNASFDSTFLMNNTVQGNLYEGITLDIKGLSPKDVERYRELFLKEIGGSVQQPGAEKTEPENTAPKTRSHLEIGKDIRQAGFKSTPRIVGGIKRLDYISGKENKLKDICKAYRNDCAGLSGEERELVKAIAEECRAQQLARMAPVQ